MTVQQYQAGLAELQQINSEIAAIRSQLTAKQSQPLPMMSAHEPTTALGGTNVSLSGKQVKQPTLHSLSDLANVVVGEPEKQGTLENIARDAAVTIASLSPVGVSMLVEQLQSDPLGTLGGMAKSIAETYDRFFKAGMLHDPIAQQELGKVLSQRPASELLSLAMPLGLAMGGKAIAGKIKGKTPAAMPEVKPTEVPLDLQKPTIPVEEPPKPMEPPRRVYKHPYDMTRAELSDAVFDQGKLSANEVAKLSPEELIYEFTSGKMGKEPAVKPIPLEPQPAPVEAKPVTPPVEAAKPEVPPEPPTKPVVESTPEKIVLGAKDEGLKAIEKKQRAIDEAKQTPVPTLDEQIQTARKKVNDLGMLAIRMSDPKEKVIIDPRSGKRVARGSTKFGELADYVGEELVKADNERKSLEKQKSPGTGATLYSGLDPRIGIEVAKSIGRVGQGAIEEIGTQIRIAKERLKYNFGESPEPVAEAKAAIKENWQQKLDAGYVAGEIRKIGKEHDWGKLPDEELWKRLYAVEDTKRLVELPAEEQATINQLRTVANDLTDFAYDKGLIREKDVNHLFHWLEDPIGYPEKSQTTRFGKVAPQMMKRKYPTLEAAVEAGKKPVRATPSEVMAQSWESLHKAAANRELYNALRSQPMMATKDVPLQGVNLKRELNLFEDWTELSDYHETEGYVRRDYEWLKQARHTYTDPHGERFVVKRGAIAVRKEIAQWLDNYTKEQTYNAWDKTVSLIKAYKLFSMFHALSLETQMFAGAPSVAGKTPVLNVVLGNRMIRKGVPEIRELVREGLQVKDVGGVGYQKEALRGGLAGKLSAPTKPVQYLTFEVIHPALKTFVSVEQFRKNIKIAEKKLGRTLTAEERAAQARSAVKFGDNLFSGEDWRMAMTETNQFMAKYWYSPTSRKLLRSFFISPEWLEKHVTTAKEVVRAFTDKEFAKTPIASAYRRYALNSLVKVYAGANLMNYALSKYMDGEGKWMFQNPRGNWFSIRMPWNNPDGSAVYARPLKSIFEVPSFMLEAQYAMGNKMLPIAEAVWNFTHESFIKSVNNNRETPGVADLPEKAIEALGTVITPIAFDDVLNSAKDKRSLILGFGGVPTSRGYTVEDVQRKINESKTSAEREKWILMRDKIASEGADFRRKRQEEKRKRKEQP